jgi:hypothetical protein
LFIGTEGGYKSSCETFHPLYVSNYYDEKQEQEHLRRQKQCSLQNYSGYEGNYAINILDDVSDDTKIFKTKTLKGIFKLGSRHWNQLFILGTQYVVDMPPDIRSATSYVAIFREPEETQRKKLYANFGGITGSYEKFCDLMDQLTGDHHCMIFNKRSQSNNREECIFWYQTKVLSKWKFGCDEYKRWAKERYNSEYVEEAVI